MGEANEAVASGLLFLTTPLEDSTYSFISLQMAFRDHYEAGRKVGNARSIRGEGLFFFLEITVILGEKSERRDQSSFSFFENSNFCKSLPRAPEFDYSPLIISINFVQY